MNKDRREELASSTSSIESVNAKIDSLITYQYPTSLHFERTRYLFVEEAIREAKETIEAAQQEIENCKDDEQAALDNLPEGLQSSERGDAMTQAVDNMELAHDNLEEAIDHLGDVEEGMNIEDIITLLESFKEWTESAVEQLNEASS